MGLLTDLMAMTFFKYRKKGVVEGESFNSLRSSHLRIEVSLVSVMFHTFPQTH